MLYIYIYKYLVVKNLPADAGDAGSIPWSRRSPGEGNDKSLQYSCLGNSMDRGTWLTTVHGVAKEPDRTEQLNYNKYIYSDIQTDRQTMEYYLAMKNERMPLAAVSMGLELIILSEVNQKEKDKYCIVSLICGV